MKGNHLNQRKNGVVRGSLNLNYLTNRRNYVASVNTLDTLEKIGLKIHPYAGFARSLYHEFTDERIDLDKPAITGVIIPRSSESYSMSIKCYPNPVLDGDLIIEISKNRKLTQVFIEAITSQGQIIYSGKESVSENSKLTLDTGNWPSNLYILSIKSEDGTILFLDKFTVFNK